MCKKIKKNKTTVKNLKMWPNRYKLKKKQKKTKKSKKIKKKKLKISF
jgi:hypothetical protein